MRTLSNIRPKMPPRPEIEEDRPRLEHEIECRLAFVDSFYRLEELVGECYRPSLRLSRPSRPLLN